MDGRHVLILAFAAQGHINPALQFANRLATIGIKVTFTTTTFAISRITNAPQGLSFASFSDGYDNGAKPKGFGRKEYMSKFITEGSNTLRAVINSSREKGCSPVSCLVYTISLSWAATVAREYSIPSATLWIQPAAVLVIYYYYHHGYEDDVKNLDMNDPTWSIQLPGLPLLNSTDLPSFILPSSDTIYSRVLAAFQTQIETLDYEEKPNVLVNTFDALEPEALKAIHNYNLIAIGPLTPSDTSFGGDFWKRSNDCKEWLDSKDVTSVIYVSFGSMLTLPKEQMEEIASGLLKTGRPFLWVIRAKEDGQEENEADKLSCMEELEEKGMIVAWCSQLDVLKHPSIGCFVTHCGWNSTLESIVSGVPVIAFPQWTDQGTNAKLIEDVCCTGVRVRPNEEGRVEMDEIVRCVEMVMDGGEEGLELRNNVNTWKKLALEAMQDGGSSYKNLYAFLQGVGEN